MTSLISLTLWQALMGIKASTKASTYFAFSVPLSITSTAFFVRMQQSPYICPAGKECEVRQEDVEVRTQGNQSAPYRGCLCSESYFNWWLGQQQADPLHRKRFKVQGLKEETDGPRGLPYLMTRETKNKLSEGRCLWFGHRHLPLSHLQPPWHGLPRSLFYWCYRLCRQWVGQLVANPLKKHGWESWTVDVQLHGGAKMI